MGDPQFYIGLMSGTSADGIDAVLLEFNAGNSTVTSHHSVDIPGDVGSDIQALSHPGNDNLDLFGKTDRALGLLFAKTAIELLDSAGLSPAEITAIGSHGQTVRHRPHPADKQRHFTIQIGDPSTIAAETGITTVADFRRKDMALGGQGAPLVPAFHQHLFQHADLTRAAVNIGGIANVTWLPKENTDGQVIGFDTGPGNGLMDGWIAEHMAVAYDDRGQWAARGTVLPEVLARLLAEPYLSLPPPKSTGKELFNLRWLHNIIGATDYRPEDVQATLSLFTARTIARGIHQAGEGCPPDEVFLCGGGALNDHLVANLKAEFPQCRIESTATVGIDPRHVEGAAFAWLARQTLSRQTGSLASVTGAIRNTVLGGIYYP